MVGLEPTFRSANELRRPRRRSLDRLAAKVGAALITFGLLGSADARAATPLPILAADVVLDSTAAIQSYTVDLGTLPTRPILTVAVTPDGAHPDLQLRIEATNWFFATSHPGACYSPSNSFLSTSGPGAATLPVGLIGCDPSPGVFANSTVSIKISAVNFGSGSAPASVAVMIRGETRPATETLSQQVDPPFVRQQIQLGASKDTVLYEDLTTRSNGAGDFLWAGHKGSSYPSGNRHALLAFDVNGAIRPTSIVQGAFLTLQVTSVIGSGGSLALYQIDGDPGSSWAEGDANGASSEFDGAVSPSAAATWNFRSSPTVQWRDPGGDRIEPPLDDVNVTGTALLHLNPPALVDAVQEMVSYGSGANGFLLRGPGTLGVNRGIQIASSENTSGAQTPLLTVLYTPTEIYESGTITTHVVPFISEGQNFRWIYDLDHDRIFVTNIGGVCEVANTPSPGYLPYTYRYQGTPGYTGVDCCTWRIDSSTGAAGTGQVLFFHNLDASIPGNMPPDTDQDGIRNLCDNCATTPNGPLRGACLTGPTPRAPCRSNQECGTGGTCSLSQEDANGDFTGDVCAPEPGFAAGLAAGLSLIAARARRRTRR